MIIDSSQNTMNVVVFRVVWKKFFPNFLLWYPARFRALRKVRGVGQSQFEGRGGGL
jgi:hypothetical protein